MLDSLTALVAPLLVMTIVALGVLLWRRWPKPEAALPSTGIPASLRLPRVNDDLCIGCEKCIAICPKSVLDLVNHKSKVARQGDCISCQKCAEVCPTQAIIMYEGDVRPTRQVSLPNLDEHYQSREVPGLYLIGEAAGKPLVKNGVNLGRAAVEHLRLKSGLVPIAQRPLPPRAGVVDVDVIILGAGPAGLSAGMTCLMHKLSYAVLERSDSAMSTVMRYPKSKSVHAEPRDVRCVGLLPVWDCGTLELRAEWNRIIDGVQLNVVLETSAEDVQRDGEAAPFLVTTKDMRTNGPGPTFRAQRAIVAIGGLGIPKKLGGKRDLPGENLPHVRKALDDAQKYQRQTILVVGGGDSAIESAVDLARPPLENRVLLSYYKKEVNLSCNRKNLALLTQAITDERVLPLYESSVLSFDRGKVRLALAQPQKEEKREKDVPADMAFVLIGGEPPRKWLEQIHVNYADFSHADFKRPATDRLVDALVGRQADNNQPGRPLTSLLSALSQDEVATLITPPPQPDVGATLVDSLATILARRGAGGAELLTMVGARRSETIKVARDSQIFRLPERAQVDEGTLTISQILSQAPRR